MPTRTSPAREKVAHALVSVILRSFARARHACGAAREDGLYELRRDAVSRRAFGRVDDGQTAGGACADIKKPAAVFKRSGDRIGGARDLGQCGAYRAHGVQILVVDQFEHGACIHAVNVRGTGVAQFCFWHQAPPSAAESAASYVFSKFSEKGCSGTWEQSAIHETHAP